MIKDSKSHYQEPIRIFRDVNSGLLYCTIGPMLLKKMATIKLEELVNIRREKSKRYFDSKKMPWYRKLFNLRPLTEKEIMKKDLSSMSYSETFYLPYAKTDEELFCEGCTKIDENIAPEEYIISIEELKLLL